MKASHSGTVLNELGLSSNQVWGLTKTDREWSEQLEAALTATVGTTSSPALTPRMWRAASAANAGGTSGSGWPRT